VKHGAYVIQTDYPFHLVSYLNQQGLHEALNKEGLFDLALLPMLDTNQIKDYNHINSIEKNKKLAKYHEVKQKETIYSISRKYNITIKEIYKLNPYLKKEKNIKKGQKLRIL
jgi:hypothetical protein